MGTKCHQSNASLPVASVLFPDNDGHSPAEVEALHNPALLTETVGYVARGTTRDAETAIQASLAASKDWGRLSVLERAEYLRQAATSLADVDGHWAELLTREHGKPLWESRLDVNGAAAVLSYYAGLADEFGQEHRIDTRVGTATMVRRPLGVTAVIVPWNYPVYLAFLMLVPALLAGNTVVVKPSEMAPLTLTQVLERLAAVLPPGVVTAVNGGAEVGKHLAGHPQVRGLFFTGSTRTGQEIVRSSAGNLKRLGLELGGNDPAIVLDTATLTDERIREMVKGVFTSSGQVCYSIKRLYVPAQRYSEFVSAFADACGELTVGDGLDPSVDMGPISNAMQYGIVDRLIHQAASDGARVLPVGRKADPSTWTAGHFMLPTLVTEVDRRAAVVLEEQFGPVVPVIPYRDEDDAIQMANSTEHGLAASVWSDDLAHAHSLAQRIEAGSVFINAHRIGCSPLEVPFGGVKASGLGRRHGLVALEESSELQAIVNIDRAASLPGPSVAVGR